MASPPPERGRPGGGRRLRPPLRRCARGSRPPPRPSPFQQGNRMWTQRLFLPLSPSGRFAGWGRGTARSAGERDVATPDDAATALSRLAALATVSPEGRGEGRGPHGTRLGGRPPLVRSDQWYSSRRERWR